MATCSALSSAMRRASALNLLSQAVFPSLLALRRELEGTLYQNCHVREALELENLKASRKYCRVCVSMKTSEWLRVEVRKRIDVLVHNVEKLQTADATARNPMQTTNSNVTPTEVLLRI